jgi:Protein of unknown function (DUF3667)
MDKTHEESAENSTSGDSWTCITCGREASGNFCAHCGEKRSGDHDFSLAHVLAEAAEAFFHVDSKIFVTLKTLVLRPGKLTAEFFLGRRKPYMSPLQTFFVCNLLFFVLQPLTGLEILAPGLSTFENNSMFKSVATRLVDQRLTHDHLSRANAQQFYDFSARFYRNARLQAKSLILVLVPLLAIILAILNLRRRRYFSEHLIFALQAYAWWMVWLLAILVIAALSFVLSKFFGHQLSLHYLDLIATSLEFGGFGLYLFFAGRRFYHDQLIPAGTKAVVLTFCSYGLFELYRLLLFFTALYST